ncbi:hypothetical protein ACFWHT_09420 [Microbacterium sp. NPDC058342]|uniref:hypothetical protein n=1 Tax=Microbacterium sp. NPDC058342 TaxID=3346454 RepID=UPI00365419C1
MRTRPTRTAVIIAALCALLTPLTIGAAASSQVRPALCIPLIWCPKPTPEPTPSPPAVSPSPSPSAVPEGDATQPVAPDVPDGDVAPTDGDEEGAGPETPQTPSPAEPDDGAPIFTGTPAQMASKGLSFTGLSSIGLVTVPTIDGDRIRVLKISADTITITGFSLSVRPPEEDGLVTDADTMTLRGNVTVYLGSLTATGKDGRTLLTLGVDTPPSLDDVEPGLLNVSMGLVGTIADSISYTNTDQRIVAKK